MNLKFSQLPPGASFEWQGEQYVKVNPLLARNQASGKERMVPRSAAVQTHGEALPVQPRPAMAATVPSAAVAAGLERFAARCAAMLEGGGLDEGERARLRSELDTAVAALRQEIWGDGNATDAKS